MVRKLEGMRVRVIEREWGDVLILLFPCCVFCFFYGNITNTVTYYYAPYPNALYVDSLSFILHGCLSMYDFICI